MKQVIFALLSALAAISFSPSLYAANPARVEVLYMNHGPLMDTLNKMKGVFAGFEGKIQVSWHDFESTEGEQFMAKKGITQHVPLVIWIEDTPVVKIGEREIKFVGFPTGAGPAFFQGKWTIDDLRAALDQATARK